MMEINGDSGLTAWRRLLYLAFNLRRNLASVVSSMATQAFTAAGATPSLSSPARHWSDRFIAVGLPKLLPPREIAVLEIGCGSGSLCGRLAALGYAGRYVGIDVDDRFSHAAVPAFAKSFVRADATAWQPGERFDLIISVSALEHIADDAKLIATARTWLKPSGLQLHIVPAAWGLPLYLWHGWRQYNRAAVAARFPGAQVWRLGGAVSFAIHFLFITLGELLLPLRARRRAPRLYGWALRLTRLDNRLGMAPANLYAIAERAP